MRRFLDWLGDLFTVKDMIAMLGVVSLAGMSAWLAHLNLLLRIFAPWSYFAAGMLGLAFGLLVLSQSIGLAKRLGWQPKERNHAKHKLLYEVSKFQKKMRDMPTLDIGKPERYYRVNLQADVALETFRCKGFRIPTLFPDEMEKTYVIAKYFEELTPYIESGYVTTAKRKAKTLIQGGKLQWDKMSR